MRAYHAMKHIRYNIKSSKDLKKLTLKHAKLVEMIRAVVPRDSKTKSSLNLRLLYINLQGLN